MKNPIADLDTGPIKPCKIRSVLLTGELQKHEFLG
jgi:hypothetical protein